MLLRRVFVRNWPSLSPCPRPLVGRRWSLASSVPLMKRNLIVALVLVTTGCVHRAEPHFAERKCAKGTEMWDVPYQGQITQVCVMVDPVTKQPNFTVPVVAPGVDPYDTDGDEGAAADKRHKHHFLTFWRRRDQDPD
jgi:hypothetical protein